jgi:hypothetical protein
MYESTQLDNDGIAMAQEDFIIDGYFDHFRVEIFMMITEMRCKFVAPQSNKLRQRSQGNYCVANFSRHEGQAKTQGKEALLQLRTSRTVIRQVRDQNQFDCGSGRNCEVAFVLDQSKHRIQKPDPICSGESCLVTVLQLASIPALDEFTELLVAQGHCDRTQQLSQHRLHSSDLLLHSCCR